MDKICPYDGYQTVDAALYMEPEHDPFVGKAFQERYRIEERLAIGGMGTVYRASQIAVGRPVAIKILRKEIVHDLRVVARFQQEALAVAGLHHPNTVRIFDFGQSADGHLFLVMEYLEGESLGDLIDSKAPLEATRVIRIAGQILDALAEAHTNGIIHRDLKPDNIFVTKVGLQPDFVKILDFGIAKLDRGEARKRQLTQTGIVVGSPGYMAPEQVQSLPLTAQVDIYAVGAVMYEMLCGEPVFSGESAFEIAMKQVNETPRPPRANGADLSGPLVDLVMSFLNKKPEDRPEGATEALRQLQACLPDEDGAGVGVNRILPIRASQPAMLNPDVRKPRVRRSTSVFFSPGTGMSTIGGHKLWIALLTLAVGGLIAVAITMSGEGGKAPSLDDGSAAASTDTATKSKAGRKKAARAASKDTTVTKASDASAAVPGAKESKDAGPESPSDASTANSGVPTVPRGFEKVADVPSNMDWAVIEGRPKGTKIYLNFGRGNTPEVGTNRAVVAWPKGSKRPKIRLKKRRHESYGFQIPKSWIGKTRRIKLEWDDAL